MPVALGRQSRKWILVRCDVLAVHKAALLHTAQRTAVAILLLGSFPSRTPIINLATIKGIRIKKNAMRSSSFLCDPQ